MGTAEAVPFSTEVAAAAFVKEHGGRTVRFDAVPRDYILEQQAGSGTQTPSGEVD
jgi:copper chaperone NosL